jgi:hypothetical protein
MISVWIFTQKSDSNVKIWQSMEQLEAHRSMYHSLIKRRFIESLPIIAQVIYVYAMTWIK